MEQDTNYIGQAIRKYRHEKKLSQDDLARVSGVSYNAIVKLEKKDTLPNPTITTLQKIAGVLGVEITELVSDSGLSYPYPSKFINYQ